MSFGITMLSPQAAYLDPWGCPRPEEGSEAEMSETNETVSFVQIVTAVTPRGALLYGLTTGGAVYEYNFSREVWIPLPMRALPEGSPGSNVVGLRGPGDTEQRPA